MQKKIVSLLFIFTLVFSLSCCQREERIDFSELLYRINRADKEIALEREKAFFSDSEWFVYASVNSENDHLISVKEDESRQLLSVSVTALNTGEDGAAVAFRRFCELAGAAFAAESTDVRQLLESAGLYSNDLLFVNGSGFSESGRYKVSAFYSDVGCTVRFEIK